VRTIPKVGGTKDVKLDRIRELAPTHAILNIDENSQQAAADLAEFVEHIVVTHPQGPRDNLELYGLLGAVFGADAAAERLCTAFEAAYDEVADPTRARRDVLISSGAIRG
jgi:ABC-type Fe3+-hydroxamate transport system substrate-binding protein